MKSMKEERELGELETILMAMKRKKSSTSLTMRKIKKKMTKKRQMRKPTVNLMKG